MMEKLPEEYLESFIKDTVQKALLERLLYGHARETEYFPQLLEHYDILFHTDRFAVAAITLPAGVQSGHHEKLERPPEPNIHAIATSFLSSMADWDAYPLLTDRFYCALLCAAQPHARDCRIVAEDLLNTLLPYMPVCVALSQEKEGLGGINDAYYEVVEAVGSIDMRGLEGVVVPFSSLDEITYQQMDTTFERDRRLINFVLEGNQQGAEKMLQQIENSSFIDGHNTLMMEKRHMMGVINQMTAEITASGDRSYMSELQAFQKIMDAPALENLFLQYHHLVTSLCEYYQEKQANISISRACAVRDYIDAHYQNPELSIDQLSGIFKISPSYLSRVFKRETDNGILSYIQKKRIEKAQVLLTSTDMRISEISVRVGFVSDQTFTRTFKTYTGTTPAKYRQIKDKN